MLEVLKVITSLYCRCSQICDTDTLS